MTDLRNNPQRRVRVALAEQYIMVAETFVIAMRTTCAPVPVLIEPGSSRSSVASAILTVRPDIAMLNLDAVVADEDLPIEQLAAAGVVTVVLTDQRDDARSGAFLRRGAEAALSTELGLQRLVNVVSRVAAREPAMDLDEFKRLRASRRPANNSRRESARRAVSRLSPRENHVLRRLMAGQSATQIARDGFTSELTVRTQIRSVLTKLDVQSQLSAVAIAYDAGLRPERNEPLLRSAWGA